MSERGDGQPVEWLERIDDLSPGSFDLLTLTVLYRPDWDRRQDERRRQGPSKRSLCSAEDVGILYDTKIAVRSVFRVTDYNWP
jgi:hypothetical protein